jgi:hypothetical protein
MRRLPEFVLAFGRVTGFVVNFKSDFAIRYDLHGRPVAMLDEAVTNGHTDEEGNQLLPSAQSTGPSPD